MALYNIHPKSFKVHVSLVQTEFPSTRKIATTLKDQGENAAPKAMGGE